MEQIKNQKQIKNNVKDIKDINEVKYELCNNKKGPSRIIKETYNEYLNYISKRDKEKDRWIYNIIDGITEQENIMFRDEFSITMPTYTWDTTNVDKLHVLCIPIDKTIRTIRELTRDHFFLLKHMKKITLDKIEEVFGLKEENLKIFFHYKPSTFHLHLHFVNTKHKDIGLLMEYSHELDSVLFNLQMDDNYYKNIRLNRRS